jgi:protein gp37
MWGPHAPRQRTSPANWRLPLRWDCEAAAVGERRRVFCASLADVFDNRGSIQPEWRADLWALIRSTPSLDWTLLTKRPGNIAKMLPSDWGKGWRNVWLGCTVVKQDEASKDIPKLVAVPARVRFLSMEPLPGPVDLTLGGAVCVPCSNAVHGLGMDPRRASMSAAGGATSPALATNGA